MSSPLDFEVQELPTSSTEYKVRKQLLLLATLVFSNTYTVGLNPPGGVLEEDTASAFAGTPALLSKHAARYLVFYYCNTAALAASLVAIFLLLLKNPTWIQLAMLRLAMVLGLLGLLGAYLAGSCWDKPAIVYAIILVLGLSAYVGVRVVQIVSNSRKKFPEQVYENPSTPPPDDFLGPKQWRKILLLLATFVSAFTYAAGLMNPAPGIFWGSPYG